MEYINKVETRKKEGEKMVVKTKKGKGMKGNEYRVVGRGGKQKIVVARNIREAGSKAKRLFPRASLITVSRKPSHRGQEYETYTITR